MSPGLKADIEIFPMAKMVNHLVRGTTPTLVLGTCKFVRSACTIDLLRIDCLLVKKYRQLDSPLLELLRGFSHHRVSCLAQCL